ncbi:MAG: hypothetical protein KAS32_13655 [Candidatus Peribacteraceae bacterium]|nr:hypothetical protein [Candidatus Peribacteraceae bacterium]
MLTTSVDEVYKTPMSDIIGIWKTKDGKYDQRTYEYEIDNLEKYKEKRNG